MSGERVSQISQARDTFHNLLQISHLLDTGLDAETLTVCVRLCEMGINPDTLASVIEEIRKTTEMETTKPA